MIEKTLNVKMLTFNVNYINVNVNSYHFISCLTFMPLEEMRTEV